VANAIAAENEEVNAVIALIDEHDFVTTSESFRTAYAFCRKDMGGMVASCLKWAWGMRGL